jgi:hypothetical protein
MVNLEVGGNLSDVALFPFLSLISQLSRCNDSNDFYAPIKADIFAYVPLRKTQVTAPKQGTALIPSIARELTTFPVAATFFRNY